MIGRRGELLNLARHPFLNARPVRRTAALLWIAGVGLIGLDLYLYWGYLSGFGHRRNELGAVEERIREEERAAAAASQRLAGLDLKGRNAQAVFLNARIEERAFSWSGLFDDVAEVLPRQVRLLVLAPSLPKPSGQPATGPDGAANPWSSRISLRLRGVAETEEALLEFLDRIFASRRFANPNLSRESRDKSSSITFVLSVDYYPAGATVTPQIQLTADAPVGRELRQRLEEVKPAAVEVEAIAEQAVASGPATPRDEVRVRLTGTAPTRAAVDELVAQVGAHPAFRTARIARVESAAPVDEGEAGADTRPEDKAGASAGPPGGVGVVVAAPPVRFDVDVVYRPEPATLAAALAAPLPAAPTASSTLEIRR